MVRAELGETAAAAARSQRHPSLLSFMRRKIGCCSSRKKQLLFVVFRVAVGFELLILSYYDEFAFSSHLTELRSVYVSSPLVETHEAAAASLSCHTIPPLAGGMSWNLHP